MIWLVLGLVVIIVVVWIVTYNSLVNKQTDTDNAWSQIDVQLKRRNDLIPNLVSTVKGYANYERNTLTKVVQLRGQLVHIDPNQSGVSRQDVMNVSNQLGSALKSLFAVSERYPDLHANDDFRALMSELTNTENKIAFSRQLYNNTVAMFNAAIRKFPYNLIAGSKFTKRNYLQTPDSEKQTPHVDFSDLN